MKNKVKEVQESKERRCERCCKLLWNGLVRQLCLKCLTSKKAKKMKIKSIKNTGTCCPSQWEGITESNEVIYIKYRWGRLTIQLSEPNGTITDAVNTGRVLCNKQIGAIYDGVITLEDVMEIMKKELIISEV